jgi:hypothetical protein
MKPRTYNEREFLERTSDFERVVKTSVKYCDASSHLSRLLGVLFAMESASLIRASLEAAGDLSEAAEDLREFERGSLPELDTVRRAVQRVTAAVASNNRVAVITALKEMGVFALCPIPDKQLWRMERVAKNVSGRARLVFLVELSLFAADTGNYDALRKYVIEAWSLDPNGWELHNFCTFEGLFALEAGSLDDSVRYLEKSLRACQADEHTLINCALRPPNFLLAQRLLERGARDPVLRHLVACKTVWQRSWMPMEKWINLIESGRTPDFDDSEGLKGMRLPSCRLDLQWMRARSLEKPERLPQPSDVSFEEVIAAKEKLLANVDRYISTEVEEAIKYLDKGLDAPQGQLPANPSEPGQPE